MASIAVANPEPPPGSFLSRLTVGEIQRVDIESAASSLGGANMPAREFSQLRVSLSSGNLRATLVQYPLLMAELDAIEKLRPTGGLMLRRDGSSLTWFGKG